MNAAAMDGYTAYLLVAYGVTTLVVIGNVVAARQRVRRTRERLKDQVERQLARRPGGNKGGNEASVGRPS